MGENGDGIVLCAQYITTTSMYTCDVTIKHCKAYSYDAINADK